MTDRNSNYLLGVASFALLYKCIEAQRSYKFQLETLLGMPSADMGYNIVCGLIGVTGLTVAFKNIFY